MTVSTEVDHNEYTGNGVTTSFPYTFRIFHKSDLVVQVVDLDENITDLVLDTDYTVTGAGGYTGGNVILTTALENGFRISIARELPVTQETDLRNQGKFFAEVHEDAFDKLTMLIQKAISWLRLSLRKPSFVANYYDALNNYIRNLRDPSRPQDAATKNYVDSLANINLSRTLRTPEPIPELPGIELRKNKIVGMDSAGNPVMLLPESGSAADVMLELASIEDGKGDALIGVKQPFTGAVPRTQHDKNAEIVSVKDFGAVGDGVNDDTAAFQKAFAAYASIFIPAGTYKVTDLTLDKSAYGEQQVSVVRGDGAIITGNSVTLLGWRRVKASGLTFSVSGYVTLMDVRNCTFSDIDFGATRFGRWEELGRATYSIYWNKFNECRFAGMYAKTDIDSANFNSNVFDSCELRRRLDTDDAIFYFYETPNQKAVFSGTTFIGCDASYTAVFKVVDPHITWAVVWVGGFIDSGSKWFADGSNEVTTFDVVGARVPARDARPYTTPTANIGMQSGGAKNSRYIPSGSLSYLPRFKRTVAGTEVITILSLPLPCSGEWTISANLKEVGTGLEATAIANTTKGEARKYDLIEHSGFSTTTFKADAGDVIEIIFDGKVGTATEIQSLSLTLGAGVPSAVEVNDTGRRSITNLSVGVATTIFSFTIPNYSQAAYDMQLVCKNKTSNGAGLLMKRASVLAAKTAGAARVNILEYSESSVAGDAGTSTNAGTCTLTSSVSGNTVSIMATLGNTGAAGITAAELVLIAKEI